MRKAWLAALVMMSLVMASIGLAKEPIPLVPGEAIIRDEGSLTKKGRMFNPLLDEHGEIVRDENGMAVPAGPLNTESDIEPMASKTACGKHGGAVGDSARLATSEPAPKTLTQALQSHPDYQLLAEKHDLDLSGALLATAKDSDVNLVMVPVVAPHVKGVQVVWAYYDTATETFGKVVFFELLQGEKEGQSHASVQRADGALLVAVEYQDGQAVSSHLGDMSIMGEDWYCFAECVWNALSSTFLGIVCGTVCAPCMRLPNLVTCTPCLACLGVVGAFCHGFCWR